MIEITTIGAGGGSIASVDRGGLLQVAPESAGSVPGPACYGQGNTRPTLTDAHVVLGRINANRPIGGRLARLDVEAAKHAILTHVGRPLGIDVLEAAEACLQTHGGFGFAEEFDVERKFREARLYQVAPISTNLILCFLAEQVLGLPKSYGGGASA